MLSKNTFAMYSIWQQTETVWPDSISKMVTFVGGNFLLGNAFDYSDYVFRVSNSIPC